MEDENNNYWRPDSIEVAEDAIQFHSQISIEDDLEMSNTTTASHDVSFCNNFI